jgi:hypothetical protein
LRISFSDVVDDGVDHRLAVHTDQSDEDIDVTQLAVRQAVRTEPD